MIKSKTTVKKIRKFKIKHTAYKLKLQKEQDYLAK